MIAQLEQERDLLRKDKETLETKLSESVFQSPREKPLLEKIQSENVTLKQEIANLKLAQGEGEGQNQSLTKIRELKQEKLSLANEVASLRQALQAKQYHNFVQHQPAAGGHPAHRGEPGQCTSPFPYPRSNIPIPIIAPCSVVTSSCKPSQSMLTLQYHSIEGASNLCGSLHVHGSLGSPGSLSCYGPVFPVVPFIPDLFFSVQ